MTAGGKVTVTLTAAAYFPAQAERRHPPLPYDQKPYWDVERARVGDTREVPVEIVVNGKAAGRQTIVADGKLRELKFEVPVTESSWIAARVLARGPHEPGVRHGGRQADPRIAGQRGMVLQRREPVLDAEVAADPPDELAEAKQAYDHAREVYRRLIGESAGQ